MPGYAIAKTFWLTCLIALPTVGCDAPRLIDGAVAQGPTSEQSLDLAIRLKQIVYQKGAPIDVELSLRNVSKAAILLNKRFSFRGPDIYLEIRDSQGREVTWLPSAVPRPVSAQDFVSLVPGETVSFVLRGIQRSLSQQLINGVYAIGAVYKNNVAEAFGLRPWIGEIYSKNVDLEIID